MKKSFKLFLIFLLGLFGLSGCGVDKIKADNPANEKEIISYVQKQIYDEFGDEVDVEILEKKELRVCTEWFDTCFKEQDVENGYSYALNIINKDSPEIISTGTYHDGYIIYDDKYNEGKMVKEKFFDSDYKKQKGLYLVKMEFENFLNEKFNKYYLFRDNNSQIYNIFINSSDYDIINSLLLHFNNTITKYKNYYNTSYNLFVYKDEKVFNNINFEIYREGIDSYGGSSYGENMIKQYTEKEVVKIGSSYDFNYDLFISNGESAASSYEGYIDYKTFSYLVFLYSASSNSNRPSFQILGVK